MRKRQVRTVPAVDVVTEGRFLGIDEYARRKVTGVLRLAHEPALAVRVRLTRPADPAVPVAAAATVELRGHRVHVGVTAPTARESVDLLVARLRRALEHRARRREPRRTRPGGAGPRSYRRRPPDAEPEIVVETSFAAPRTTIADAAAELDRLGFEFLLFTAAETGQDVVLYRDGPTGYRLAELEPSQALPPVGVGSLTAIPGRPPLLTPLEAAERLEAMGLPFVFFLDAERGRGEVVHRRHDGAYGLVLPPV
jgi:hypothetical protein